MKKLPKDRQLAEFEKKDLGHDIRRSHSAMGLAHKSRPTSILLPEGLIQKLKRKAGKKGIGYQTMLKIILMERVDEY